MKEKMSFQTIVLAIFIVIGVIGVGVFSLKRSETDADPVVVNVWGTVEDRAFREALSGGTFPEETPILDVRYRQISEGSFEDEVVEALAEGRGPDIILAPHPYIFALDATIITIPYTTLPQRNFQDNYILASEVLLSPEGIKGIPLAVDPVVMYWNRDMLASAGYVNPPRNWEELPAMTRDVTEVGQGGSIERSTVAFGEYANVSHAKALLSTLFLQAGTSIMEWGAGGERQDAVRVDLPLQHGLPLRPAESTLRFFTEYSNPASPLYTWNRSLPDSRRSFLSEELALYFAPASERDEVRAGNPNLNLDIAPVPQIKDTSRRVVYADVYTLAIMNQAVSPQVAFQVVSGLTSRGGVERFVGASDFAPARKDVVVVPQEDPFTQIVFKEAVIAEAWVDIDPQVTARIFQEMVENVTSGRLRISESITRATGELEALVR